jgi:hypothetical protein
MAQANAIDATAAAPAHALSMVISVKGWSLRPNGHWSPVKFLNAGRIFIDGVNDDSFRISTTGSVPVRRNFHSSTPRANWSIAMSS